MFVSCPSFTDKDYTLDNYFIVVERGREAFIFLKLGKSLRFCPPLPVSVFIGCVTVLFVCFCSGSFVFGLGLNFS